MARRGKTQQGKTPQDRSRHNRLGRPKPTYVGCAGRRKPILRAPLLATMVALSIKLTVSLALALSLHDSVPIPFLASAPQRLFRELHGIHLPCPRRSDLVFRRSLQLGPPRGRRALLSRSSPPIYSQLPSSISFGSVAPLPHSGTLGSSVSLLLIFPVSDIHRGRSDVLSPYAAQGRRWCP